MINRLRQLFDRLQEYSLWEVAIEIAVIWVIVYGVVRFVRGTRAAGALKGLVILILVGVLLVRVLGRSDILPRLSILVNWFLGFAAIALIVTFAPELRRALLRLGEGSLFRAAQEDVRPIVEAITEAATFLSKNKFGAIIAIERQHGLREMIETGRPLNADLSSALLNSIFWPNSPLHDMGVVIRAGKVVAAGVQFPLADPADMPDGALGTRHRAAVGLARSSDAVVVVVSEETGAISIAEGMRLDRWLTTNALREELTKRLAVAQSPSTSEPEADMDETIAISAEKPSEKRPSLGAEKAGRGLRAGAGGAG